MSGEFDSRKDSRWTKFERYKANPFIVVRPRKGDNFSKTPNQDNNEYKKWNSHSDKNTDKDQSKVFIN